MEMKRWFHAFGAAATSIRAALLPQP